MSNRVPPVDLESFFKCTWTMYDEHNRPYFCGRKSVAVYEGPLGRLPRCRFHEAPARSAAEYRRVSA